MSAGSPPRFLPRSPSFPPFFGTLLSLRFPGEGGWGRGKNGGAGGEGRAIKESGPIALIKPATKGKGEWGGGGGEGVVTDIIALFHFSGGGAKKKIGQPGISVMPHKKNVR